MRCRCYLPVWSRFLMSRFISCPVWCLAFSVMFFSLREYSIISPLLIAFDVVQHIKPFLLSTGWFKMFLHLLGFWCASTHFFLLTGHSNTVVVNKPGNSFLLSMVEIANSFIDSPARCIIFDRGSKVRMITDSQMTVICCQWGCTYR